MSYQYDSSGALVKSRNWRGDGQDFSYDAQFNITHIDEFGIGSRGSDHFTIDNTFDEHNRFKAQRLSTGAIYSVQYITDNKDIVIQANVRSPEGFSRYFFNALRYETRQEFTPVKGPGWTYELARDPKSNATSGIVVRCQKTTIELPVELDAPLGEDGESRIAYLSAACKSAESKVSPDAKRSSARRPS